MEKDHAQYHKAPFFTSVVTSGFLLFVFMNDAVLHITNVLAGVFQEMLSIPCILAQPILLIISANQFFHKRTGIRMLPLLTMIISIATILIVTAKWQL